MGNYVIVEDDDFDTDDAEILESRGLDFVVADTAAAALRKSFEDEDFSVGVYDDIGFSSPEREHAFYAVDPLAPEDFALGFISFPSDDGRDPSFRIEGEDRDCSEEFAFAFYDALRESGQINMFAAPGVLSQQMGVSKETAKRLWVAWTETFEKREG